ncbi:hypothetical protein [Sphingobacterium sp. JB170]|uniref:hypothetical protein n=1 Tax=Sphingobacterium sp. JB170 TaxID=1434842 RepID=UPI00097F1409|nr:hypothetical protein [Sphingobacterium sp. JB170]SJN46291.1 hypothetical protein FM107_14295 [Sphingobacterium sp. JB170]
MVKIKFTVTLLVLLCLSVELFGQQVIKPSLNVENLEVTNRKFRIASDDKRTDFVRIKGQPNAGIVWIKDLLLETGTIEFEVRGKDVLQESFVGIAFHGTDDSTYQAVYFRPFNFQSNDPIRKKHAVQYISLPENDWPYLREEFPDKYEAPISTEVNPNYWFRVKVVVTSETITTYINTDQTPVLTVQSLRTISSGKVGFWTGNGSDGDFANLKIIHSE